MKGKKKKSGNMRMMFRFLKGIRYLFVLSLLFAMIQTALNAMTPQIIRFTVDTVIGGNSENIPQWLQEILPQEADLWMMLLGAAGLVLVVSLASGVSGYFSRMTLARGQ